MEVYRRVLILIMVLIVGAVGVFYVRHLVIQGNQREALNLCIANHPLDLRTGCSYTAPPLSIP